MCLRVRLTVEEFPRRTSAAKQSSPRIGDFWLGGTAKNKRLPRRVLGGETKELGGSNEKGQNIVGYYFAGGVNGSR